MHQGARSPQLLALADRVLTWLPAVATYDGTEDD